MTIAAEKKDEKVEKRRALGRGLESLLPGPRVVTPPAVPGGGAPAQGGRAASEQQIPHFVRNDKPSSDPHVRDVRAVVEEETSVSEEPELRSGGEPGATVPKLAPVS